MMASTSRRLVVRADAGRSRSAGAGPRTEVGHPVTRQDAQAELVAEEVAHELLAGAAPQFLRRSHLDDPALPHQHDAVAEEDGLLDIVRDEDHRLAQAPMQGGELALQPLAADGVEGAEGLVHEQDRRVGGQRPGHADALSFAARQLVGRLSA